METKRLSSGRMFDRKWISLPSLAGLKAAPLPVPTYRDVPVYASAQITVRKNVFNILWEVKDRPFRFP